MAKNNCFVEQQARMMSEADGVERIQKVKPGPRNYKEGRSYMVLKKFQGFGIRGLLHRRHQSMKVKRGEEYTAEQLSCISYEFGLDLENHGYRVGQIQPNVDINKLCHFIIPLLECGWIL